MKNPPYFWERRAIRPSNRNPRLDTYQYRPIVLKLPGISVIDPEIYGMPKVSLFRFSDIKKKKIFDIKNREIANTIS